jgi:hypothetical protein
MKLRLIIIGFDNLTNNDSNSDEDNDILTIISLASEACNAGKSGDGGSCNRHRCPPRALAMEPLPYLPLAMVPRMSATYPALLPPSPPSVLPKSAAQFFWTLLPSEMDIP